MEFKNKAEMIENISRTSNTSLEDLYDKVKTLYEKLNPFEFHDSDKYEDILSDEYLMLSVYQKVSDIDSYMLGLFNRSGRFKIMPYVFYDYFEVKQQWMKNELPKLEKEINTRDKELSAQSSELFQNRMAIGGIILTDSNEMKNKFVRKPNDAVPILKEWKENLGVKAKARLFTKQQEVDNKRHELYSIHKPIKERGDRDMEHLVIQSNDLKYILDRYNRQGYLSLKQIQRELKSELGAINKKLYIQAFQTIRHEGIEASKALLKWIVAPNHLHRGYLYKLDKELANHLDGVGDTTIRDFVIKKLNKLRNTGAKTWFKIKLIEYVLRCQKNAEDVSTDGFYLKMEKDSKPTKTERMKEFSDDFVTDLISGKYTTNKEVISALQKIESSYRPAGNKELNPLRSDNRPYEKRICESLSVIFELKEDGETIDWTVIRDHYQAINKKIQ